MKLVLSVILGIAVAGAAPGIRVRVVNLAHIPERTVVAAQSTAGDIFRASGVPITWVDCAASGACHAKLGPSELWLQLLSKRPSNLSESVLGFSLLTKEPSNNGGYAAVAWQGIREVVQYLRIDEVPVLGAAMAHELGHLILGPRAHSRNGVMVARFGRKELEMAACGTLHFSDVQAEAIRRFAATSSP